MDESQMTKFRFMTIEEARALECNQCGDCCGTNENQLLPFSWGQLPKHQYKDFNNNEALIIPLNEKTMEPRQWRFTDNVLGHHEVLFKCQAFCPQNDGTGKCGIHNNTPQRCSDFPVFSDANVERAKDEGEYVCGGHLFPRCTWHGIKIVDDKHPLLSIREADGRVDLNKITPEIKRQYIAWKKTIPHPFVSSKTRRIESVLYGNIKLDEIGAEEQARRERGGI